MSCCVAPIDTEALKRRPPSERFALLDDLRRSARKLDDGSTNILLSTPAIHCGACLTTIESNLGKLPGVSAVRANLSFKRVSLTSEGSNCTLLAAVDLLAQLGFPAQPISAEDSTKTDPQLTALLRALAVAGFAATNIMLLSIPVWNGADGATRDLFHFVSALIAIPSVAYGGLPFFRSAWAALRHRRTNMDVPISLGVLLATGMSLYESTLGGGHAYFDAATSLLFFLLIGRTLDHLMRTRARAAADRLVRMSAKGGLVVEDDGNIAYVALENLAPGMRIRVAAGERFPVDGIVHTGTSDADRALVTGESAAQPIAPGATIEAGTLNLTGPVDIIASRAARDSFLAEVARLMSSAESGRSAYVRTADRMARIYAPAVHILALAAFAGWMIATSGDWHQSLTVAIAVLIITCPCALGLAVPVAHVVSAGRLFRAGILLKDGAALERMATTTEVMFDKTGTLTTGQPTVRDTTIPAGRMAALAKGLALHSAHPAARALVRHVPEEPEIDFTALHEIPGCGVEARCDGHTLRLGRASWVAEIAVPTSSATSSTGFAFAMEHGPLFTTRLAETLRADATWTIAALNRRGLATRILSGDGAAQVARIAKALSITSYLAGLRPGGKVDALASVAAEGRKVLMVGDGLNDAPALVAAHVSMAPSSASDIGRSAADFVFTHDSLSAVVTAHAIAVATGRIVRQNFAMAILYNVFAVPLAISGQLNPLMAAIAMSTSSTIVVGNSLRLHVLAVPSPDGKPHVKPTVTHWVESTA
jgi:P-type Cu2+ transporter